MTTVTTQVGADGRVTAFRFIGDHKDLVQELELRTTALELLSPANIDQRIGPEQGMVLAGLSLQIIGLLHAFTSMWQGKLPEALRDRAQKALIHARSCYAHQIGEGRLVDTGPYEWESITIVMERLLDSL